MFDWLKLAVLVLQLVDKFLDYAHDRGLIQQGRDEEIAKVGQSILLKTKAGKAIWEKIDGMDEAEVDKELRGLEPAGRSTPAMYTRTN